MEEATRVEVGAAHYVHDGSGWLRTAPGGALAGYVLNTELLAMLYALAARTREVEEMRALTKELVAAVGKVQDWDGTRVGDALDALAALREGGTDGR